MSGATSSFWLWLILLLAIFIPSNVGGQQIITAETEQDITLPCRAPNNIIGIEWSRAEQKTEYVLLFRDGRSDPEHQDISFKNRVDLRDREMKDGDASLILKGVTTADAGTYECRVRTGTSRRKRAYLDVDPASIIYLSVVPSGPPVQEKDERKIGRLVVLSVVLLVFVVVTVVGFLIHRNHKQQQSQDPNKQVPSALHSKQNIV